MLKNLLNTEVVQVVEQVKDWREAVAISCRPLIENGSIEPRYVMLMRSITRTTLSVRTMWLALVLRCLMRARKRGLTSCH